MKLLYFIICYKNKFKFNYANTIADNNIRNGSIEKTCKAGRKNR